jgi:hypothetical protein
MQDAQRLKPHAKKVLIAVVKRRVTQNKIATQIKSLPTSNSARNKTAALAC